MTNQLQPLPGEFLLYETEDGRTRVECRFVADTLWLPQAGMAELFQTSKQNVAKHLKAIFTEGELRLEAVVNQWLTTASDGKNYRVAYYSLEAILAVGYRVRSPRGTQFRRWATERLAEYLVKGFTLDDERLKNPPVAGSAVPDRFDELLERIRDIRASERRMYLRVREIFSMAADYSPTLPETTQFFRFIQNKLHFAVTGKTAAELIAERADSRQPNMGLTTWKSGSVQKADVTVAKNYLRESEISELNRIVTMWLDFAEDQARRRKEVFLKDWAERLDAFLTFNERDVLTGAGRISKKQADAHAENQYEQFAVQRRALLEAEGADANVRALEDAAKALPKPGRSSRKRK
ncbi:virulence RhuM family protein [Pseudomonas aeruginosa]|uniref:virulence RhuM family protein n=1 Tax=Pseudomonas aeruginosa TaxID=287 RepID=UPI00053F22E2|nr:virulence RhuM family protein [Pseudomonas aeruginosa]MBG5697737.1 virulence RhuM family protein [Pseudomonas aeruginosa]MBI7170143.1 virulence RhuM family protein [Pseudomonas aeruginosa]MBV5679306.1 virulence RhuM family protein [Pseudomonas aeruginosa]MCO2410910.1 hydroxyacid dehydrogenase [Pseudomonas aeruginosa]MCO2612249.1 hydroxyacid dehydrogenase [Pseudomonas aeruginosa]